MFLQCPDSDGIAFANGNAAKSGKGEPCCCVKGAAKVKVVGVREAAEAPILHMNCEYSVLSPFNFCLAVVKPVGWRDRHRNATLQPDYRDDSFSSTIVQG